jgi:hypothetical protein
MRSVLFSRMVSHSVQGQAVGAFIYETVKLPDDTAPKAIESSLKLDAMHNARSVAINVFGTLMGCVPDRGERNPNDICPKMKF